MGASFPGSEEGHGLHRRGFTSAEIQGQEGSQSTYLPIAMVTTHSTSSSGQRALPTAQ